MCKKLKRRKEINMLKMSVANTNDNVSKSIPEIWERHHIDMLNEVLNSGKKQVKYKNSTASRIFGVCTITSCSMTCCAPCIIWDCMCCCVSICMKKNPFKWGIGFDFVTNSCKNTFEDTRTSVLDEIKLKHLNKDLVISVLKMYLEKYDECLASKTVDGARKANIIRVMIVTIIRKYSPGFEYMMLRDDGDILKIREIIKHLPAKFDKYFDYNY